MNKDNSGSNPEVHSTRRRLAGRISLDRQTSQRYQPAELWDEWNVNCHWNVNNIASGRVKIEDHPDMAYFFFSETNPGYKVNAKYTRKRDALIAVIVGQTKGHVFYK